jgi:hypothetical protein
MPPSSSDWRTNMAESGTERTVVRGKWGKIAVSLETNVNWVVYSLNIASQSDYYATMRFTTVIGNGRKMAAAAILSSLVKGKLSFSGVILCTALAFLRYFLGL